jgi:hypothetical protein
MSQLTELPTAQDITKVAAQMFPQMTGFQLVQFRNDVEALSGPFFASRYIARSAFNTFASAEQAVDLSIALEQAYPALALADQ